MLNLINTSQQIAYQKECFQLYTSTRAYVNTFLSLPARRGYGARIY